MAGREQCPKVVEKLVALKRGWQGATSQKCGRGVATILDDVEVMRPNATELRRSSIARALAPSAVASWLEPAQLDRVRSLRACWVEVCKKHDAARCASSSHGAALLDQFTQVSNSSRGCMVCSEVVAVLVEQGFEQLQDLDSARVAAFAGLSCCLCAPPAGAMPR